MQRRRLLPKVIIALIVLLGAGAAYLYLRPPHVVASFVVTVEEAQVLAPVAGRLSWTIGPDAGSVSAGQKLGTVVPGPEVSGSPAARRRDLKLRAADARAELSNEKESLATLESDLAAREADLEAEINATEAGLNQARSRLEAADAQTGALALRLEDARRLRRLEALTAARLSAIERDYAAARATRREAEADADGLRQRLRTLRERRERLAANREDALDAARSRVEAAAEKLEHIEVSLAELEEAAGDASDFAVVAATAGRVLETHVASGSQVRRGDLLVTLYEPDSAVARAFVPVRFRERIKPGQQVRLYPRGEDEPTAGRIVRFRERVAPLPGVLRRHGTADEGLNIVAEIEPAGGALRPGMVGEVIIPGE